MMDIFAWNSSIKFGSGIRLSSLLEWLVIQKV